MKVAGTPEPLDVAAAWKEGQEGPDRGRRQSDAKPRRRFRSLSKGVSLPKSGKLYLITGADEMACNVPGKEPGVRIRELPNAPFGQRLKLPPISISLYELNVTK